MLFYYTYIISEFLLASFCVDNVCEHLLQLLLKNNIVNKVNLDAGKS